MIEKGERFVALATLVALFLVVGWTALGPVRATFLETKNAAADQAALNIRLLSRLSALETKAHQLSARDPEAIGWRGTQIGEMSAQIQNEIGKLARQNLLRLRSVTVTRPL